MNKKLLTICLIVVLTLSVMCFASCKINTDAADRLREINTALMKEYSKVELNVTATDDEVTLKSQFELEKSEGVTKITYWMERLSTFDVNGEIPSEMITNDGGTAIYDGEKITSIDGEAVDVQVLRDVVDCNLTFKLSYLSNINVSNNELTAKVTDPKGFLGNDKFEGTNMSVRVTLNKSALSTITVRYKVEGTEICLDYTYHS